MTDRAHGTRVKYVIDKCHCEPCTKANREYAAARNRARVYGHPADFVAAEPVRQHVLALQSAGLGRRRIAELAGLPDVMICALLHGKPGRKPTARLRPATADALLAITASEDTLAGGQLIDATLTWKRIRSLIALGYPRSWIASQILGRTAHALQLRDLITVRNARAIKALYDRIGDTPGPSQRARAEGKANGWPRPAEWSDSAVVVGDLADEPDIDEIALERAIRGDVVDLTRDERIELVLRMHAAGRTATSIARAANCNGIRVAQILDQHAQAVA